MIETVPISNFNDNWDALETSQCVRLVPSGERTPTAVPIIFDETRGGVISGAVVCHQQDAWSLRLLFLFGGRPDFFVGRV